MNHEDGERRTRMEIAVYPLGTGDQSVSRHVSAIFDILDRSGLTYEITLMGTLVEGSPDDLFALARELHEAVLDGEVRRVITVMKIDDRYVN